MNKTPKAFADKISRQKISTAVGVVPSAVANAVERGVFPASWFIACKSLADDAGIECPPLLFGMRGLPEKRRNPSPALQDPETGVDNA